MRRWLVSFALVLGLAPGCAHHQLTNRQVAIGVGVAALAAIVIVAATASHCEENGCLTALGN